MVGWQIVEFRTKSPFPVAWDNIGLRLIQIAHGKVVWVLDMWKIKGKLNNNEAKQANAPHIAFPVELLRIFHAVDIPKAGVGVTKDLTIIWDDLRTEMKTLVDVGMMAKLLLAEKYPKTSYGNLSLKTSVEEVLGIFN
jgi:hypothetical protein